MLSRYLVHIVQVQNCHEWQFLTDIVIQGSGWHLQPNKQVRFTMVHTCCPQANLTQSTATPNYCLHTFYQHGETHTSVGTYIPEAISTISKYHFFPRYNYKSYPLQLIFY